jgi:hypothetical protein
MFKLYSSYYLKSRTGTSIAHLNISNHPVLALARHRILTKAHKSYVLSFQFNPILRYLYRKSPRYNIYTENSHTLCEAIRLLYGLMQKCLIIYYFHTKKKVERCNRNYFRSQKGALSDNNLPIPNFPLNQIPLHAEVFLYQKKSVHGISKSDCVGFQENK